MQISRTWECPRCGHEIKMGTHQEPPDQCPKCGWPKPERKAPEPEIDPKDWPAL